MKVSQRAKDYITIWNTGVSFIYFAYGAVTVVALIMMMQFQAESAKRYGGSYSLYSSSSSMSFESVVSILFAIIMFVAGITNLFYARRYLRDDNPRSTLGWVATTTLAASNIYLLISVINSVAETQKTYSSYGMGANVLTSLFLGSQFSWVIWLIAIVIVFNAVAAVMGFLNMVKWSPITIDSVEDGDASPIAADVATHAMGYAAPATVNPVAAAPVTETQAAPEVQATPAASKDLPPMLNADPDAPVQQPQSGIRDGWQNPGPTAA